MDELWISGELSTARVVTILSQVIHKFYPLSTGLSTGASSLKCYNLPEFSITLSLSQFGRVIHISVDNRIRCGRFLTTYPQGVDALWIGCG